MRAGWRDRALCREFPALPWIDEAAQITGNDRLAMAAVCQKCPVLSACDSYVSDHGITAGFWAGRLQEIEHDVGGEAA